MIDRMDLEDSPLCAADRFEIFNTTNAVHVTMDDTVKNSAVLCGDGIYIYNYIFA